MERKPFTPKDVSMIYGMKIRSAVSFSRLKILDIDFSRGIKKDDLGAIFWMTDGGQINISRNMTITSIICEDLPEPLFEFPDWMTEIEEAVRSLMGTAAHQPCIDPNCDTIIDLRKRKSGACCREHMNYECSHSNCVERAAKNNWMKATHPFGTKIAKDHLEYRVL